MHILLFLVVSGWRSLVNTVNLGPQFKDAIEKHLGKQTNAEAPASRTGKEKVSYPSVTESSSDNDFALERRQNIGREVSQSKAASSPFPFDETFDPDEAVNKCLNDLNKKEAKDLGSNQEEIGVEEISRKGVTTTKPEGENESGNTLLIGEEAAKSTTMQHNLGDVGGQSEGTDKGVSTSMKDLSLSVFIQSENHPILARKDSEDLGKFTFP